MPTQFRYTTGHRTLTQELFLVALLQGRARVAAGDESGLCSVHDCDLRRNEKLQIESFGVLLL